MVLWDCSGSNNCGARVTRSGAGAIGSSNALTKMQETDLISRRQLLASATLLSPLASRAEQALPAGWPSRPIKLLVGFPAGQGSDLAARYFGEQIQPKLGQPIVVDNKPGAGATIAVGALVASPPDGYNILFTSSGPMSIGPHLYSNLPFDVLRDIEPVALVATSPLMLVVRPDHPAQSVAELVAMTKTKPFTGGSGGNGATNHVALEMFKLMTGAVIDHVPYKGAAPALADLMGKHIDMMFETTSAALGHVKAGRLKALAVTTRNRYSELPHLPAIAESFPQYEFLTWGMIVAPKGTPKPILESLNGHFNDVLKNKASQAKLTSMGVDPVPPESPAKAKEFLIAEYKKLGEIIQKAKIKIA